MTDKLLEAVAQVVRKKGEYHWAGGKNGSEYIARAAILETLRQIREPGEGVRTSCFKAWQRIPFDVALHEYTEDTVWQAMIDRLIAEIGDD